MNPADSVTAAGNRLAAAAGGSSAGDPVFLSVNIALPEGWTKLLSIINTGNKYVALDLTRCTMDDTEFDPRPGWRGAGENRIVSLVLPGNAKSIKGGENPGGAAFRNFTTLAGVTGMNITNVGAYAFHRCTRLASVTLPSAKTVGRGAFRHCARLTGIVLPAAETVGQGAFEYCTALTSVALGASFRALGVNTFRGCINLTGIAVDGGNAGFTGNGGMLLDRAGTTLVACPAACGNITLAAITRVGEYAFCGCTGLTSISLPAAADIGEGAFCGCTGLTSAALPSAKIIGSAAFSGCTGLASISLPSAAALGHHVFQETGPVALTVAPGGTAPRVGRGTFYGVSPAKNVTVTVPPGAAGYGIVPAACGGSDAAAGWANGFRGAGWNGSAPSGASGMNCGITLTIRYAGEPAGS
jgi:hypothetical protein